MKLIPLLLIFLISVSVKAQDTSIAKKYVQRTVFLYGGNYMLDGERLPASGLKVLLNKYSESRTEYIAAKKWKTAARVLVFGSFGLNIYALSLLRDNNSNYKEFFIASLITQYISFPIGRQGKKHFDKSVWLYNKNALAN
ncbi:MAG TPA: hypothetical protein VF622_13035 [Segetibacter sp.]|jgi:hypothetical protein